MEGRLQTSGSFDMYFTWKRRVDASSDFKYSSSCEKLFHFLSVLRKITFIGVISQIPKSDLEGHSERDDSLD